ncbi:YCII-related protein [Mucilaginibacter paludis DSM 18603]|uniref:YCII-related protein n=2 Tax=Mucilaginibacter TaxID=423349 RepID=H1Y793_9SPHI|nr:YCII-related protein [Mucilaginibacter paludis DSM 18603]
MNQYLVIAYDFTDDGALERRMAVRPAHLEGTRQLRQTGNYILGGAILDDHGRMIGSTMVLQFDSDGQLEAWKKQEPYITQHIWEKIEIRPFKVAGAI